MRASRKLTEPAVCQSVRTRISSSNNAERAVLWTYRFCRIFDGIPLQRWFWKGVLAPLTGTSLALIRQEFLPHQQHCSVSINTTPKSTERISINRPYRQSRSEAINTHTSMVHHCREQQPKSSPLLAHTTSALGASTRKNPQPNTPNQHHQTPRLDFPESPPASPEEKKRIHRPTRSDKTSPLTSPQHRKLLFNINTRTRDDRSPTSPFENATRNHRTGEFLAAN
jgi:hypothetical protein